MFARLLFTVVVTGLIIGGIALTAGRKSSQEGVAVEDVPPPPPKHWTVDIDPYHDFRADPGWRLHVGGERLEVKDGTSRGREARYRVETERDLQGLDFVIEFETPDGWLRHPTVQEVDEDRKHVRLRMETGHKRPRRVAMHVDNRGGPAATLRLGQCARPVRADAYAKITFYVPLAPENAVVFWDDKPRGVLLPIKNAPAGLEAPNWYWFRHITLRPRPKEDAASTYLVDPTSSRTYKVRKQEYGGVSFGPAPKDTWTLKPRFLHALPALQHWQQRNPKAVPEDESYARFSVVDAR